MKKFTRREIDIIKDQAAVYFINDPCRFGDNLFMARCYLKAIQRYCQQNNIDLREVCIEESKEKDSV